MELTPEQTIQVAIHYISQIPANATNAGPIGDIRSTMRFAANGLFVISLLCGIPILSKETLSALPKYNNSDANNQTLVAINAINSIIVPISVQMNQTYGAGIIKIIEKLRELSTDYLRTLGYKDIVPPALEYEQKIGGKRRRTRRHRVRKARTVRRRTVHRR